MTLGMTRISGMGFALASLLALASAGIGPAWAQEAAMQGPNAPGMQGAPQYQTPAQPLVPQVVTADNETLVTVSGAASTALDSDEVTLTLGVYTVNKTASSALDENGIKTQNVINALESAGVSAGEIHTSYFSINPIYQNSPGAYGPGNLTAYSVSNTVVVTSTNIGSVSSWIDTAVKNGADSVYFYFAISNGKVQGSLATLTSQAISDAKAKASQAASDVGMKVVSLKSMSVYNGGFYGPLLAASSGSSGGPVPIMPGQQQVSVSVSAVYEIGP